MIIVIHERRTNRGTTPFFEDQKLTFVQLGIRIRVAPHSCGIFRAVNFLVLLQSHSVLNFNTSTSSFRICTVFRLVLSCLDLFSSHEIHLQGLRNRKFDLTSFQTLLKQSLILLGNLSAIWVSLQSHNLYFTCSTASYFILFCLMKESSRVIVIDILISPPFRLY